MPQIPLVQSEQTTRVGGIDVYANPDQFGAQVGRAIQQFGQGIGSFSSVFAAHEKQQQQQERSGRLANNVAESSIKFAEINTETQLNAPADGAGTAEFTLARQRALIEDRASKITDPVERQAYVNHMTEALVPYAVGNINHQAVQGAKNAEDKTNTNLNGFQNLVRTDATQYDNAVKHSNMLIDAQAIPQGAKDSMKAEWTQKLAYSRFQGMMASAKSSTEFDLIAKDLTNPKNEWVDKFSPEQFNSTLDEIGRGRNAFMSQAKTAATSMLTSAEARLKDGVLLAPDELQNINSQATASGDTELIRRSLAIERKQQITEKSAKLPAAELDNRANSIHQGGYPGMPDRVNQGISAAIEKFPGVSQGFLGGTIAMEYGVNLHVTRGKPNGNYTPKAVGKRVFFDGVQKGAMQAITTAGEIYGAPLPILSASRSQKLQDSIRFAPGKNPNRASVAKHSMHTQGEAFDISTVGMTGAQKGKLVDSLVQAGFTGFGEYDTHIHADTRASTPDTFYANKNGGGWLGWSKGSPEVVAALVNRGYGANVSGSKLNRGDAAGRIGAASGADQSTIDYSLGTGNASTSATGITQQTKDTWLESMRNPNIAQRLGMDTANMSEAALLELRKNPEVSIMVTAAQAEQNKPVLEKVFGRSVTDAELYMAHMLGMGGAQTLISAYTHNPDAIAADIMPTAAKNNPGRFYDKSGKPYTMRETYDNLSIAFSTAPNQVQYEDAKTYEGLATSARKAQNADPVKQYSSNVAPQNDLSQPGGFSARGTYAMNVADYYDIPVPEMKPFNVDEATALIKIMSEGNAKEQLQVIQSLQDMDKAAPGMGQAAMAQIGVKDTVFGQAANLANERGDKQTAETIIRGANRMRDDKTIEPTLFSGAGATPNQDFNSSVGVALLGVAPLERSAIYSAAKALYAEQSAQQGDLVYNSEKFKAAVIQVTGGSSATPAIDEVNGVQTIMPQGVTGEQFDSALDNLGDDDLIRLSVTKQLPIGMDGLPVTASDIADQGHFVFGGGDIYTVRMNDGGLLTTNERDDAGNHGTFKMQINAEVIKGLASKATAATPAVNGGLAMESANMQNTQTTLDAINAQKANDPLIQMFKNQ